jgi:hypothetical protein
MIKYLYFYFWFIAMFGEIFLEMITTLATNKKFLKKSLPPNTGANMNE